MKVTLSGQETNELIKEYQDSGRPKSMRNLIATNNIPLMKNVLKTYGLYTFNNKDVEEIEQEAFILMLEAMDKYDYTRGAFSSFLFVYLKKIFRKTEDYNKDISLDAPLRNEENENASLLDTIEDEESTDLFEELELESERKEIRNRLTEILTDEEKQLLYQYYGINSDIVETPTYKQLSEKYNVSIEMIRKRIEKAKRKLRHDHKLRYIYNDYQNPSYIKSTSILEYRTKTNKYCNTVELLALKRIEQEQKIKKLIDEALEEHYTRISRI